jgi:hypothetical protein
MGECEGLRAAWHGATLTSRSTEQREAKKGERGMPRRSKGPGQMHGCMTGLGVVANEVSDVASEMASEANGSEWRRGTDRHLPFSRPSDACACSSGFDNFDNGELVSTGLSVAIEYRRLTPS